MRAELEALLSHNAIFSLLSADQRQAVQQRAQHRRYPKGSYLALYGDVWPYLFIVADGQVDGVKESEEGRQLILLSAGPGAVFWGLAFFKEETRMPVSLQARQDSQVFLWSREALVPLLRGAPDALWRLCEQMIGYMQHASQIVEGLAFQPVAGRLASFLLSQFAGLGETAITRDLTLDQIAAKIGTTREQTCRALYQFSDQNLITITRTELQLLDKAGLARVAGQS
ncbi:MAG: Crp/Fnr family transcriptional regulator [Chloroflexota bacterium]|jgi:CRP/FNR family transcriptional regulator|nr:Crp/Fnr family transcriptional regulator [Anaerolineae bacterium]HMM28109.1 Crp/Fnr family transcriptional regulator [Aggregatilineaceae bacterium]